jgi:membrane associated rhomboid family serine protease
VRLVLMGLSWVIDIALLDMRRMSPSALWGNIIAFGVFGVGFTAAAIVAIADVQSWAHIAGALVGLLFGAIIIARIVQGWRYYFGYTRTRIAPPLEKMDGG